LAKAEARRKLRRSSHDPYEPTPRQVGIQATMHNTCPCWMCTHKEDRDNRTSFSDLVKFHDFP
jgi:hypothetical protein